MEEQDVTREMPATEQDPQPATVGDASVAQDGALASRASVPRRWFAAAVIAVLLVAAGIGFYLGVRGEDEPAARVQTEIAEVETTTVPDLRGMTLGRATADAEAAGLIIGTVATAVVEESVTPAGTVLSQEPLPGAEVEPGGAISLVIAEAPVVDSGPASGGTSGGTAPPSAGTEAPQPPPPPPPGDLSVEDITKLTVKPELIDLGGLQLQQWTTKLEHTDTALQWTSGPVDLGAGDKMIILNADGPTGYLVAVYSWDSATSTDWKMQSIIVSQPGDLPYKAIFNVPASTQTFMVKSMNSAVLWKLTVQERK